MAMLLLPIIPVEVPLPRPLLRAVAKGYRRHAFTPCVTDRPRSACKTTHRHGLASGVSPTVRYQSRTPLAVTTIVIICLASPSARCSQDQHSCNTTAVAGGKSVSKAVATAVAKAGRVSAHSRSSSVQRASAALGLYLCFFELCGVPLTVAVFATVAAAHISGPLVATDKRPLPYEFIRF